MEVYVHSTSSTTCCSSSSFPFTNSNKPPSPFRDQKPNLIQLAIIFWLVPFGWVDSWDGQYGVVMLLYAVMGTNFKPSSLKLFRKTLPDVTIKSTVNQPNGIFTSICGWLPQLIQSNWRLLFCRWGPFIVSSSVNWPIKLWWF